MRPRTIWLFEVYSQSRDAVKIVLSNTKRGAKSASIQEWGLDREVGEIVKCEVPRAPRPKRSKAETGK